MELHVAVDEADVGSVALDQKATFTVDAYPNRRFSARITKVHFASSNTKSTASSSSSSSQSSATQTGVVTYETMLEVDNPELLLRPGMTATAEIVTTNIKDALLVPNAALRFSPEALNGPETRARGPLAAIMPRIRFRGSRNGQQQQGPGRRIVHAYVLEEGKPALVMFRAGATDGRMTQVLPVERPPKGAEDGKGPRLSGPGAAGMDPEEMRKAFERKLEPGTPVIIDAGMPAS
jgi:HlyD family secretion protein